MNYLQERVRWSLWVLPYVILISWVLMPTRLKDIFDLLTFLGQILVSVRYIYLWLRGGKRIDFIIYILLCLFMPVISILIHEITYAIIVSK